jgi:hypothetical protein
LAANKNSKSRATAPASRNKGPKGKRLKIDGVTYRMVRRADGRYNLYVEGRSGAVGSTPLVDAKDYSEARKRINELTKEFAAMDNAGFVAKDEATVSADDYQENTEETPKAPESDSEESELDLNDLDKDGKEDYRKATGLDRARARAARTGSKAGDFALNTAEAGSGALLKFGMKTMSKNLGKIVSANDPITTLPAKALKLVSDKGGAKLNRTTQENKTAFKREDESLRTARLQEARRQNAEAIKAAKSEGYAVLEKERAALDVRRQAALKSGNSEELAAVNAELKTWSERKAKFDKVTPPNVKLPFPKLPRNSYNKGRTAVERRRINKTLKNIEVDEKLAARGRKSIKAA